MFKPFVGRFWAFPWRAMPFFVAAIPWFNLCDIHNRDKVKESHEAALSKRLGELLCVVVPFSDKGAWSDYPHLS